MRRIRLIVSGVIAVLVVSVATPAGATTAPWTVDRVPTPTFDVGSFTDVSCPTADFCLAVGGGADDYLPGSAARWDGTGWTALALPDSGVAGDLASVSCASAQSCLAVGADRARNRSVVLAWDGSVWSAVRAPATGLLAGVACVTAVDCTAVGEGPDDRALVEHWDGQVWSVRVVSGLSTGQVSSLTAVACASSTLCFAVGTSGRQLLVTGKGDTWSTTPLPPAADGTRVGQLYGVSCGSPTSCFAVGEHLTTARTVAAALFGWDGTDWTVRTTPDPGLAFGSSLVDVACTGPSSCEAVGTGVRGDPTSYAQRFDGTTWTSSRFAATATGDDYAVSGVDCGAVSSCVSVGSHLPPTPDGRQTMAQVGDGAGWRIVATPDASYVSPATLAAVSCDSDRDCAAVGRSIGPTYPQQTLVERWNGVRWAWTTLDVPFTPTLVSCGAPGHCVTVGSSFVDAENRLSSVLSGGTWTTTPIARPPGRGFFSLAGLSCTGATSCLLVGSFVDGDGPARPLVEQWTPAGWSIVRAPTVSSGAVVKLVDVSCVRANWCLAIGSQGAAQNTGLSLVWNGTRWREIPVPVTTLEHSLRRVSCASTTFCAAVGGDGQHGNDILHWDGTAWRERRPVAGAGAGSYLNAISCGSATSCTAVGRVPGGGAYSQSWDGTGWTADTTQPPGTEELHGVSCHAVCHAVTDSPDTSPPNPPPLAFSRPAA